MFAFLLLAFITLPIIEIALLIKVGSQWGVFYTIALVIFTAVLGAFLVRQQGLATVTRLHQQAEQGHIPARAAADGIMLLLAGAVLVTPGFITDVFGFALLIPKLRGAVFDAFVKRMAANSQTHSAYRVYTYDNAEASRSTDSARQSNRSSSTQETPSKPSVLEGQYRDGE